MAKDKPKVIKPSPRKILRGKESFTPEEARQYERYLDFWALETWKKLIREQMRGYRAK